MNRRNTINIKKIINTVYDEYEQETGQEWARWRRFPFAFTVAQRATACQYCDEPIQRGQLRLNVPTCHIECYVRQTQEVMTILERIHTRMTDQHIPILGIQATQGIE